MQPGKFQRAHSLPSFACVKIPRVLFDTIEFLNDRHPRDAAMNMALDETLLAHARSPMLRVYRWRHPSVSFGYFEKWATVAARRFARDAVRRWTGGGVVLHGADFTYTLLVPAHSAFLKMRAVETYRAIHERVASALAGCGLPVSMTAGGTESSSRACFENAVTHDVLLDGQKIAGAAQRRTRRGLLHQGSVQNVLLPEDFAVRLAAAFNPEFVPVEMDDAWMEEAEKLRREKYATQSWLRKF